jgi:hypothetical protein
VGTQFGVFGVMGGVFGHSERIAGGRADLPSVSPERDRVQLPGP